MAITNEVSIQVEPEDISDENLENFNVNNALKNLMQVMHSLDERIATNEPFKMVKTDPVKGKEEIRFCLKALADFANQIAVYLPDTSAKIIECIRENKMPERALFNRLT